MEKIRKLRLLEIMLAIIGFFMISPMKVQAVVGTPVPYRDTQLFYDNYVDQGCLQFQYQELNPTSSDTKYSSAKVVVPEGYCCWFHVKPEVSGIYHFYSVSDDGDDPFFEIFMYDADSCLYDYPDFGEEGSEIRRHKIGEADNGQNATGDFRGVYELTSGYDYYIRVSGYAQSELTDTFLFGFRTGDIIAMPTCPSATVNYGSAVQLNIFSMKHENLKPFYVFWYYLNEEGERVNLKFGNDNVHLNQNGEYTSLFNFETNTTDNSLFVPYSRELNGKTVTYQYVLRYGEDSRQDDAVYNIQVYGTPYDTGLLLEQSSCPEYVSYDERTVLSLTTNSADDLTYQWYHKELGTDEYVLIEGATDSVLLIEANSYYRGTGLAEYRCVVRDTWMEKSLDFSFVICESMYADYWTVTAEHEFMRPGTENRLYASVSYQKYENDEIQWYRWNSSLMDYELIPGANSYIYTITAEESSQYRYGETATYKCKTSYPEFLNFTQEKVVQVRFSALRDDQYPEYYYLDYYSPITINTYNCKQDDPTGNYTYTWTIMRENDSVATTLSSNSYSCQLNSSKFYEGQYVVTCRTYDKTINATSIYRAYVLNCKESMTKFYNDPDVVIDSDNGNDLEAVLVGRPEEVAAAEYGWEQCGNSGYNWFYPYIHLDAAFLSTHSNVDCYAKVPHSTCPIADFYVVETHAAPTGLKHYTKSESDMDVASCSNVYTLSGNPVGNTGFRLEKNTKVAVQIPALSSATAEGTWDIQISGIMTLNDYKATLYDSQGYELPCVSGMSGQNMWIRFERTSMDACTMIIENTDELYSDMKISAHRITSPEVHNISIYCDSEEYRLANDYSMVSFSWDSTSPNDALVKIYADGLLVDQGNGIRNFFPNPCYDIDNDGILILEFKVSDGHYWSSEQEIIYFETLLLQDTSGSYTDHTQESVSIKINNEILLDPLSGYITDPLGIVPKVQVHNLFSKINAIWYRIDNESDTNLSGKTPLADTLTYSPDTSSEGVFWYLVQLDNGVNCCQIIYQLTVQVGESEIDENLVSVSGLSVTLFQNGTLGLNTYILIPSALNPTNYQINETLVTDLEMAGRYNTNNKSYLCYKYTISLAAAEMSRQFDVVLTRQDTGEVVYSNDFSVVDYMDVFLNNDEYLEIHPEYEKYASLARAVLRYGSAAQVYFNYDTERLADELVFGADDPISLSVPDIPELVLEEMAPSGDYCADIMHLEGLDYLGASLILQSDLSMRFYFLMTRDDAKSVYPDFMVDDDYVTFETKGNTYYIELTNLGIGNLDVKHAISVSTRLAGTLPDSGTMNYSGLNYLYLLYHSDRPASKNLAQALYSYHFFWKELTES